MDSPAAQLERKKLQNILDAFPGYVSFLDENLRYADLNSQLQQHYLEKSILGQKLGTARPDSEFVRTVENFFNGPNENHTFEIQMEEIPERPWYLVSLKRIKEPKGLIIFSINIDSVKKAQAEVEAQKAKMISSSRFTELGEMAGAIAHEINNPLAIISGKVQVLSLKAKKNELTPEDLTASLTSINQTSMRISKIVRGLKSIARNAEADPLTKEQIDTMVEDTLSFCQARLKDLNIELRVDAEGAKNSQVMCRPSQVSQVLLNLFNNSVDAIEKMPNKWIELKITAAGSEILFEVTDSGPGLPEDVRKKLMTPFFTTKPAGKGTGLGLNISREIAKSHGGRFYLDENSPNTKFVLALRKA